MLHREPFALTLLDYADDYQWIRMLGWSDDELGQVQVHEVPDPSQEMLDLANFGGTRLPVSRADLVTSADVHNAIRNIYVYRSSTPPSLWRRLTELVANGGPAGPDPTLPFLITGSMSTNE